MNGETDGEGGGGQIELDSRDVTQSVSPFCAHFREEFHYMMMRFQTARRRPIPAPDFNVSHPAFLVTGKGKCTLKLSANGGARQDGVKAGVVT